MSIKPQYVGQQCFNLDQEDSKWKRLRGNSAYKPVVGYRLVLGPLPTSRVALCKRKQWFWILQQYKVVW